MDKSSDTMHLKLLRTHSVLARYVREYYMKGDEDYDVSILPLKKSIQLNWVIERNWETEYPCIFLPTHILEIEDMDELWEYLIKLPIQKSGQ